MANKPPRQNMPLSIIWTQRLWLFFGGLAIFFMLILGGEHYARLLFNPSFDLCSVVNGWGCNETLSHPLATVLTLPAPFWAIALYSLLLQLGPFSWKNLSHRRLATALVAMLVLASGLYLYIMERDLATLCPLCIGTHFCHFLFAVILGISYWTACPSPDQPTLPLSSRVIVPPLLILLAGFLLATSIGQQAKSTDLQKKLIDGELINSVLLGQIDRYYPALDYQQITEKNEAPFRLTIIGSPACRHCRTLLNAVSKLPANLTDKIAVYFIPYPLSSACNKGVTKGSTNRGERCLLAEKAMKAQQTGQFWPFYRKFQAAPGRWLRKLKRESNAQKEWLPTLINQLSAMTELPITGIPTILWDGRKLPKALTAVPLEKLLPALLRLEEGMIQQPEETVTEDCDC